MKLYKVEHSEYGTGVVYYLDDQNVMMIGGERSSLITVLWDEVNISSYLIS